MTNQELPRTQITKDKVLFGERELTNLCWTLIRVFRFRSHNENPKAIVFPHIKEVGGVEIIYPEKEKPRRAKNGTIEKS